MLVQKLVGDTQRKISGVSVHAGVVLETTKSIYIEDSEISMT